MNLKWRRLMITLGIVVVAGCAHVVRSGFISDYGQLQKGKHLEKVMISPELHTKGVILEIRRPKAQGVADNKELPIATAENYLFETLQKRLATVPNLRITSDEFKAGAAQGKLLVLETAITEMDPGSRAARWFASELGAGHSYVQVEGKLTDPGSGKILFQFADRRAGSATGGLDITGGDSKQMMEHDLEEIAEATAKTLAEVR